MSRKNLPTISAKNTSKKNREKNKRNGTTERQIPNNTSTYEIHSRRKRGGLKMEDKKITIIGAGSIGLSTAYFLPRWEKKM